MACGKEVRLRTGDAMCSGRVRKGEAGILANEQLALVNIMTNWATIKERT